MQTVLVVGRPEDGGRKLADGTEAFAASVHHRAASEAITGQLRDQKMGVGRMPNGPGVPPNLQRAAEFGRQQTLLMAQDKARARAEAVALARQAVELLRTVGDQPAAEALEQALKLVASPEARKPGQRGRQRKMTHRELYNLDRDVARLISTGEASGARDACRILWNTRKYRQAASFDALVKQLQILHSRAGTLLSPAPKTLREAYPSTAKLRRKRPTRKEEGQNGIK